MRNSAFLADHLAIDFVNTLRRVDGALIDTLGCDQDVWDWLDLAGLTVGRAGKYPILQAARELREATLRAMEALKAGHSPALDTLNRFLESASSHGRLSADPALQLQRIRRCESAEGCLALVTEEVADLLANGDFQLVRPCAGDHCVLWFYDRTKRHGRRFCSAATCGNRAKVAAFRARARKDSD